MFKVPIDKIIPVTSARAKIASLVNDVQKDKSLYVLTRSGKPAAILASIDYINDKKTHALEKKKPEHTEIEKFKETEKEPVVAEETEDALVASEKQDDVQEAGPDDEQPVKISVS